MGIIGFAELLLAKPFSKSLLLSWEKVTDRKDQGRRTNVLRKDDREVSK
jgi:hypothetical protein